MAFNRIRQALVLAHHDDGDSPLALLRTGGIPNLKRVLLTLQRKGVRRFFVITGRHDAAIRTALADDPKLRGLDIVWVATPDAKTEGEAILAARFLLQGDFLLVSGDRVFAPDILDRLQEEHLEGVTLAAERDATWTGLASCDVELFDALEELRNTDSPVELQRAFAHLAAAGRARIADVQGCYWHDLRDAAARRKANRLLLNSLRKPEVDGVIARNLNRHFSLFLTRLLMNTGVRPNHITFVTLLVSLGACLAAALASPESAWMLAAGAVLWQLASMLDGTDGELARLKFQTSKFGEWFDTIVDDTGRLVFFLGLGYGTTVVTGNPLWFRLMLVTVVMLVALSVRLYWQLRQIGAGSHYALAWTSDHDQPRADTAFTRFWQRLEFLSRRDYYIFACMVMTLIGLPTLAIAFAALTTTIVITHETFRPRQPRDRRVVETVLVRDERRAA